MSVFDLVILGLIIGIVFGQKLLIKQKGATDSQLAIFSLANYPYSIKVPVDISRLYYSILITRLYYCKFISFFGQVELIRYFVQKLVDVEVG